MGPQDTATAADDPGGPSPGRDPALPIIERHIRIDASPEAVWSVLVDLPGQPRWMRDLRDVRVPDAGPPAVGTLAIGTVHMFGFRQRDPVEVIGFDPPSHY